MKRALITGVSGQDGSLLAELLCTKDYAVFGICRSGTSATSREGLSILPADITDSSGLAKVLSEVQPDEVYHLAAQSAPSASLEDPITTADVNGLGTLRVLEAVRQEVPEARVVYASSSEVFANAEAHPQDESTAYAPRNPYGIAKIFGQMSVAHYRTDLGMHASTAILYNHESSRRPERFVTRKIAKAVAEISLGLRTTLTLGDLNARRDWGYAGDYVEALWMMACQDVPDDYIIATGKTHSVEDFCSAAFASVGLDWRDHVTTDAAFMRGPEKTLLVGNPNHAQSVLGWSPRTEFADLVKDMVHADVARLRETNR